MKIIGKVVDGLIWMTDRNYFVKEENGEILICRGNRKRQFPCRPPHRNCAFDIISLPNKIVDDLIDELNKRRVFKKYDNV